MYKLVTLEIFMKYYHLIVLINFNAQYVYSNVTKNRRSFLESVAVNGPS